MVEAPTASVELAVIAFPGSQFKWEIVPLPRRPRESRDPQRRAVRGSEGPHPGLAPTAGDPTSGLFVPD